jgi:hypothetical protein
MEQDDNPNYGSANISLQSKFDGALNKKMGNDVSIVGVNAPKVEPKNVRDIAKIQELVCDKMHKVMSPISAISGYLGIMKMLLERDVDNESLERYRRKVEEGISEIGEIVEELHNACNDMQEEASDASSQSNDIASSEGLRAS